ncbi:MAG: methylated-DNA--[protein]-cysteine S-methyltransferase [Chloroflexi bacterium]|nr:methylated-DNA--[protein]-cysteine S-methyltransferase [Chloroflexota bacterium]
MSESLDAYGRAERDRNAEPIERALGGLAVTAPAGLATAVLAEVGLVDRYAFLDSVIGPLAVAWNRLGVSSVDAVIEPHAFEERHRATTGRRAERAERLPAGLAAAISRRLAGDRRVAIELDLRGRSDFERDVWRKTLEIPRGEVRPYGWVAAEIGRPRAVRAVGTALGHNPVPLIVPCHRVVRTDGTLGQYSLGGPNNKRAVLRSEGLDPEGLEAAASAGVRYLGSDTTRVACLPTCRHARRIADSHRVPFRRLNQALAAGYRACRVCRPDSGAAIAA